MSLSPSTRSASAPDPTAHTTLRGRWLLVARVAWTALVALVLVLWGLGTAALISEPLPDCAEVTCDPIDFNAGDLDLARELGLPTVLFGEPLVGVGAVVSGLMFFIVAGVIFWRKSDDWMGKFVSFALVFIGGLLFTSANDAVDRTYPDLGPVLGVAFAVGLVSLVGLFYLFPDGRFAPRWTRWMMVLPAVVFLVELVPVPTVVRESVALGITVALGGIGVFSQVYRFTRVSDASQRQQTKWVVAGLMGAVAIIVLWSVVAGVFPPEEPSEGRLYALLLPTPPLLAFLFLIPLSFAISIMRYRLWDIDVLVNRALVYGVLTASLVGAYVGSVVLLQMAFRAATDEGGEAAIVVSTLVIAALFQPLWRRVQDLIDRRFYRRKYDAARTLAAFSATARDEVDLEALSGELVSVVKETMEPAHASLWLRRPERETADGPVDNAAGNDLETAAR